MISIRALAKKCGVSVATVNRAVCGGSIKDETKKKVLAAVEKYGYRPSPIIKETVFGTSEYTPFCLDFRFPDYFIDITNAIQMKLNQEDWQLFITPSWDKKSLRQSMERLASRRVKAMIITLGSSKSLAPESIVKSVPTLSLNLKSRQKGVYSLVPKYRQSGIDAAEYLIGKGHSKILYVKERLEKEHLRARQQGFMKIMKKNELTPILFEIDFSDLHWSDKLGEVLSGDKRISAAMCSSSWLLNIALSALDRSGYKVPEDISVLSGGGTPGMLPQLRNITSFEYPLEAVTNNILEWLKNPQHKFSPCKFTLRENGSVKNLS